MIASTKAMPCLSFFFLPPLGTSAIADPQNWVALMAFLSTAMISSHLSARGRRRSIEVDARHEEAERMYSLSRSLMTTEGQAEVAQQVAGQVAQVFGAEAVAVITVADVSGLIIYFSLARVFMIGVPPVKTSIWTQGERHGA